MSLHESEPEPARVGQYRLVRRLGEGGMGVVHLALDREDHAVAIKVLRPHIASDPEARRRLAREVATLRRVRHPRVAAVIDADVEGEVPYLVTNFVPGKPLDEHVREHGPLPRGHIARVGSVLADALRAIHAAGVVHRDVKPANVMLLDGDPILIDFGIAQVADESRITHTGLVMGTPGYLSPEIIGGEPVTAATDWWGWGATLAFAATGRPPFGTGPIEVVLDRVRRGQSDINGVDAGLRATLTAALAVDPTQRPAPDRLVAGLAAVAPARSREAATFRDAVTHRVAPPDRARDQERAREASTSRTPPPGEAPTAVVAPPVVWAPPAPSRSGAAAAGFDAAPIAAPSTGASAAGTEAYVAGTEAYVLPATRRFGPPKSSSWPDGPHSPSYPASAPPATDFARRGGQYAPPSNESPWGQPPPRRSDPPIPALNQRPQRGWSPPTSPDQPPAATPRPAGDPSRGVLLGLLVVLAAIAAVAPYGATWIAALGMVAARVIDRSNSALLSRRDLRGPRGSDVLLTLIALPWRLLTSGLVTMVWLILPILVGISTAFIAATAWAGTPTQAIPGDPGPLAAGMVMLVLTAWWGPGGGRVRRGTRKGVQLLCSPPRAQIVVWAVLGLILISALSVARQGDGPDWGPLGGTKIVQNLRL